MRVVPCRLTQALAHGRCAPFRRTRLPTAHFVGARSPRSRCAAGQRQRAADSCLLAQYLYTEPARCTLMAVSSDLQFISHNDTAAAVAQCHIRAGGRLVVYRCCTCGPPERLTLSCSPTKRLDRLQHRGSQQQGVRLCLP